MAMYGRTSSSSFARVGSWTYDVFLSFRGEDTRRSFTGFLYHALRQRGINAFIDDQKLRRGQQISPALLSAIEESRISIIIFSENYASSTWCLDELVKILECMKTRGQLVWPVFYNVDPSVVRHQRQSFGRAMAKHEARFQHNLEKLQNWKEALFQAANLSGWSLENGYEFELIQRIVEEVSGKMDQTILHIADYPVGLETRIAEVKSLLHVEPGEDICMVGIHGLGGIGKTTIARALFNLMADQFEGACFLADIRENSNQRQGLVQLQETILYDLVGDKNIKLGNIYRGIPIIKKRLCCKKVLLILDDVDNSEQLQALAGGRDWFGAGSLIIVTTRDKHLLVAHQIGKTYEMKKLNHGEACELFTWNAFKRKAPNAGYLDISNQVVLYAEGLPLALKVMGSNLFGKTVEEWKSALDKYEKIPNKEVQNVLRVTFDNLEENEKEIFLDIACFFKGETLEYVDKTLKACGFHPKFGISVLIDRSLISIDEYNRLRVHDLIQDMGREIVRADSPLEPGKRSRLWYHEDVFEVLTQNAGSDRIQGMLVDLPDQYMLHLGEDTFKMMRNLKILIVRNAHVLGSLQHLPNNLRLLDWMEYPSASLPSNFKPRKLVVLNLSHSHFTLQEPLKYLDSLTSLDLSHCEFLTKLPDVSGAPNLTELILDQCKNLTEVDNSVGFLEKLVELRAYGCTNLRAFPPAMRLTSLKSLILNWCSNLQRFPDVLGKMENLISISIEGSGIKELPPSIGNLVGLEELSMASCLSLKEIPESIDMLHNLRNLDIEGCPQLRNLLTKLKGLGKPTHRFPNICSLNLEDCGLLDEDLPVILTCFPKVASLVVSGNNFVKLPICIQQSIGLELLHLDNCKQLEEIPGIPPYLQFINLRNCISLNAESCSFISSQKTVQAHQLQAMVPGTMIPEWFDYCSKGEYMTFWVRRKFPMITLCFVFVPQSGKQSLSYEVRFYINGDEIFEMETPRSFSELETDHVWLYDLRTHPSIQWQNIDSYLQEEEWNQVEISCEMLSQAPNVTVSWCGVNICRQESNMEDILFKDPDTDSYSSAEFDKTDNNPQIANDETIEIEVSPRNHIEHTLDDEEMEAFYASLDAETSVNTELGNTDTMPSEETQRALKALDDFLGKDFSALLDTNEYSCIKATLDYLSNLSLDDGISIEKRSLIMDVSREFTILSLDYNNANRKIEFATANLLKADEVDKGLEVNKNHFREVVFLENELQNQLAYLEERKRKLEEQINAINVNISASETVKKTAIERKREIFEEAKMLKVQRDELKGQVPRLRDERELAKKIQASIRAKWSKLGTVSTVA